ncbi:MAG: alpha/beta fold hydrolase [Planctomycetota bacterium]|jgi:pimeloyl-ACP methyl ester carboxylesterase
MLRTAIPLTERELPDWDRIEELERQYANIHVPVLLIWGRRDSTLPASMGYKLAAQLPNARLEVLDRCTHGVCREAPRALAGLVRKFVPARTTDPAPVGD